jgi:hypothetical protein
MAYTGLLSFTFLSSLLVNCRRPRSKAARSVSRRPASVSHRPLWASAHRSLNGLFCFGLGALRHPRAALLPHR